MKRIIALFISIVICLPVFAWWRSKSPTWANRDFYGFVPSSTTLPTNCNVGDMYLDTDADTDGSLYTCVAANTWKEVDDDGGAGSGDISDVGDCATGACFTADGTGNNLYFEGTTADANEITLTATDPAADYTLTLPAETGTLLSSATTFGGDVSGTYDAIVVADDSHNHVITNIDAFTSADLAGRLTDETGTGAAVFAGGDIGAATATTPLADDNDTSVATTAYVQGEINGAGGTNLTCSGGVCNVDDVFLLNTGDVGTGVYDFGGATSLEIPNGAAPTVDAAGEIAVDTTDDQLVYYGSAEKVLQDVDYKCAVIENLAAADDDVELWMANDACKVVSVGVHCSGTCTTPAQISLEDRAGNAMTHTTPTASTGTSNTTFQAVTAANSLVAGEAVRFDVDNAVSPETDTYTICIGVKYTRQ